MKRKAEKENVMRGIAYGMDAAIEQDRDNKPAMLVRHSAPTQVSLGTVP